MLETAGKQTEKIPIPVIEREMLHWVLVPYQLMNLCEPTQLPVHPGPDEGPKKTKGVCGSVHEATPVVVFPPPSLSPSQFSAGSWNVYVSSKSLSLIPPPIVQIGDTALEGRTS